MANADTVFGLRPVRYLNGAPWNGQVTRYLIDSGDGTAVFIGDLVKLAGGAGANGSVVQGVPTGGMATVIQAAAADPQMLGVVVGFEPLLTDLTVLHRVASTSRVALVVDDPNVIFEVQEDAVGGALAAADVGLNASVIVAAGSTVTGLSGMELDTSTKATTVGLELKIIGFVQRENNEVASANAKILVLINNHAFRGPVTGV